MQGEGNAPRRKQWGNAAPIAPKETEGRNEALTATGVDPSYREYLAVLQEKNRVLKERQRREEERQAAVAERERGFEVNFAGANEERIRLKQERNKSRSRAGRAAPSKLRSKWQMGSLNIETVNGSIVRLAPPSRKQTRESMQWLVSDEGRSWLESGDGEQWLQEDPSDAGEGSKAVPAEVMKALQLVAATLKFNEISIDDGFAQFDSDEDGRISRRDLLGVVEALGMEMTEREAEAMFAYLDADADGFVEPEEWSAGLSGVDPSAELQERGVAVAPSPNKARDGPARRKPTDVVVSPVGQYIKTGELPQARVRQSGGSFRASRDSEAGGGGGLGQIRESADVASDGEAKGSGRVDEAEEAEPGDSDLYEDDFDEMEEEHDDEPPPRPPAAHTEPTPAQTRASQRGSPARASEEGGGTGHVRSTAREPKKIVDSLDWQRSVLGGDDGIEDTVEDHLSGGASQSSDGDEVDDIEEVSASEREESFDKTVEQAERQWGAGGGNHHVRILSAGAAASARSREGSPARRATSATPWSSGATNGGGRSAPTAPDSRGGSFRSGESGGAGGAGKEDVKAVLEALAKENSEATAPKTEPDAPVRQPPPRSPRAMFPKMPGRPGGAAPLLPGGPPKAWMTPGAAASNSRVPIAFAPPGEGAVSGRRSPTRAPVKSEGQAGRGSRRLRASLEVAEELCVSEEEAEELVDAVQQGAGRDGLRGLGSERLERLGEEKQRVLLRIVERLEGMEAVEDEEAVLESVGLPRPKPKPLPSAGPAALGRLSGRGSGSGGGMMATAQADSSDKAEVTDGEATSLGAGIGIGVTGPGSGGSGGQPEEGLVLEVTSNWGHSKQVGLTEVELFDMHGCKMRLSNAQVCCLNFVGASDKSHRLVNGKTMTGDAHDMWLTGLPPPPAVGRVLFVLSRDSRPGHVRVWNFNKSALDASKGVRGLRVLLHGKLCWEGELAKGSGGRTEDVTTTVTLDPQAAKPPPLPFDDLPSMQAPPPAPPEPEESDGSGARRAVERGGSAKAIWLDEAKPEAPKRTMPGIDIDNAPLPPRPNSSQRAGRGRLVKASSWESGEEDTEGGDVVGRGFSRSPEPELFPRRSPEPTMEGLPKLTPAEDAEGPSGWRGPKAGRRAGKVTNVEKSLESLSLFRASHLGRLGEPEPQTSPPESTAQPTASETATPDESREGVTEAGGEEKKELSLRELRLRKEKAASASAAAEVRGADGASVEEAIAELPAMVGPRGLMGRRRRSMEIVSEAPPAPPATDDGMAASRGQTSAAATGQAAGAGGEAEGNVVPRGLMALNRALEERGLLSKEESDQIYALANSGHTEVLALHKELRNKPVAPLGSDDESSLLSRLRACLTSSDPEPAPADATPQPPVTEPPPAVEQTRTEPASLATSEVPSEEEWEGIPVMPVGRVLELRIFSTWGDAHYVGLSGIDIFGVDGNHLSIADPVAQISADPPDINVLPGYGGDPRTVDNLLDGVNCTCDDLHVWLAPFSAGRVNTVTVDLGARTAVSMVRVWNYNKSRIHAARGARQVQLALDGTRIFEGELRQAPGNLAEAEERAEVILFCEELKVLKLLAVAMDRQREESGQDAGNDDDDDDTSTHSALAAARRAPDMSAPRPFSPGSTAAAPASSRPGGPAVPAAAAETAAEGQGGVEGRRIKLLLMNTWGDRSYMGMTGLEVMAEAGQTIAVTDAQITADPQDLNQIPGNSGDPRTKDKLVDGVNVTCDDRHMWLIPYTAGQDHTVSVDLGATCTVRGVRLWNYNKNAEDTCRGVQLLHAFVDGQRVTPPSGVVLRRGPGVAGVDHGQRIRFELSSEASTPWSLLPRRPQPAEWGREMTLCRQDSDPPQLPRGLMVCVTLWATHGDLHYVGLNGIQLYDQDAAPVQLAPDQVFALPSSINELPEVQAHGAGDCRTPDKLVDGVNDTWDAQHLWLAPYTMGVPNRVFLCLHEPVTLSMIRIWNYSRTPSRGASEVQVSVDGSIAFQGYLRAAPEEGAGAGGFGQSILLCGRAELVAAEKGRVYSCREEQHVLLVNERKVVEGAAILTAEQAAGKAAGPLSLSSSMTTPFSVPVAKRPTTSIPGKALKR